MGRDATLFAVSTALSSVYYLTYADWLATPDDNVMREIVEGELYVVPPPSIEHQRISRKIEIRLDRYLEKRGTGEVFDAPVGLKLDDRNLLEPDLIVVLGDGLATLDKHAVIGPADLVVEILSPGTAQRDVGVKRRIYESAGVREYWIVDPEARHIEVLALRDGAYASDGVYDVEGTLTSPVLPGFELVLREVFTSPK